MAKKTLSSDQIRQTVERCSSLTDAQRALALICYDFVNTSTSRCVRWVIVRLMSFAGFPQRLIRQISGYGQRQVRTIKCKPEGELDQPRVSPGAPPKLDEAALSEMAVYLVVHPQATPSELAVHLQATRGLSVHPKTVGRYLAQTGLGAIGRAVQTTYGQKTVHTAWGGLFLLIPTLLEWTGLSAAQSAFSRLHDPVGFVLTLLVCSVMGLARWFHLDDVWDDGVALFTGRPRLLTRQRIYDAFRRLRKAHITAFYEKTRPDFPPGEDLEVSLDEHVVARWTKTIDLAGTKHPTRNRPMKADKLFYAYEWIQGLLLSLRVTSGAPRLCQVAVRMTQDLCRQYSPRSLKLILDAGGCSLKALKGLLRLAHTQGVIFYVKAVKTPPLQALWYQAIEQFGSQEVVHPHDRDKPPDEQRRLQVTDVYTSLPGLGPELRTLLIYRPQEQDEERRLIALYTNDLSCAPAQGYAYFGQRQHHELTYRILTHDLNLDVLPKTYALHPKDPKHPNRKTQRAFLIAWIKALAFNLLRAWQQKALPETFHQTMVGTLVRKFLRRNATLQVTDEEILVTLEYFRDQHYLGDYIRSLNAQNVKIPWLDDRVVKIQLTGPTGIPFFPQ